MRIETRGTAKAARAVLRPAHGETCRDLQRQRRCAFVDRTREVLTKKERELSSADATIAPKEREKAEAEAEVNVM